MHQMQSHLCCQCLWRPQPASRASLNLAASARTWDSLMLCRIAVHALPQPQLPLKQAHGNSAQPGDHMIALPQPEANGLCSQMPVEQSRSTASVTATDCICQHGSQIPSRAAYMPMHQPGSLQNGVQETVTAPDLPTEAPIAEQRPGSQPDSMHGQALERAPHLAAHNGLPTGAMQTSRPQGPSEHAPPHAAETAPHPGQPGPSTAASLTPARPQTESCQDEWRSQAAAQQQAIRLPGSTLGVDLPGQSVAGADLPGRPTACEKLA